MLPTSLPKKNTGQNLWHSNPTQVVLSLHIVNNLPRSFNFIFLLFLHKTIHSTVQEIALSPVTIFFFISIRLLEICYSSRSENVCRLILYNADDLFPEIVPLFEQY